VSNYLAEDATISFQNQSVPQEPLLPRSAWTSQVAYLRSVFRAKKALDLIEKEAIAVKN
jgi:hypothetical protein